MKIPMGYGDQINVALKYLRSISESLATIAAIMKEKHGETPLSNRSTQQKGH